MSLTMGTQAAKTSNFSLEKLQFLWQRVSQGRVIRMLLNSSICWYLGRITQSSSEKAMAPHSSTLAWRIPCTEEPGGLQSTGSLKSQTQLNDFTFTFHFHATGEGNGNPLQCSCLENPRDGGAWWAAVYGVTPSWTRLKQLSSSSSTQSS